MMGNGMKRSFVFCDLRTSLSKINVISIIMTYTRNIFLVCTNVPLYPPLFFMVNILHTSVESFICLQDLEVRYISIALSQKSRLCLLNAVFALCLARPSQIPRWGSWLISYGMLEEYHIWGSRKNITSFWVCWKNIICYVGRISPKCSKDGSISYSHVGRISPAPAPGSFS